MDYNALAAPVMRMARITHKAKTATALWAAWDILTARTNHETPVAFKFAIHRARQVLADANTNNPDGIYVKADRYLVSLLDVMDVIAEYDH